MTRTELLRHMNSLDACPEALAWIERTPGRTNALWELCPRGDWMLWLASQAGVDLRRIVLAACACVRPALVHVPAGEDRPRLAIETAERWARGDATIEAVRAAHSGAYAAAAATCSIYAADAADARAKSLAHSADLVRAQIPWATVEAALENK